MSLTNIILLMAFAIFVLTVVSGIIPFILKLKNPQGFDFPKGEALANGVFLGAGLVHMLSSAANSFDKLGFTYPWAFVIAGVTFLVFLLSEHVGIYFKNHGKNQSIFIAVTSTFMLSVHGFFAGAALGLTSSLGLAFILFVAILAHKWAASFSLSIYINKTSLKTVTRIILFATFSLMLPLGVIFGDVVNKDYLSNPLLQPIFTSIASGTFIYLGTLHGYKRMISQKGCCDLFEYWYVVIGFVLMAAVAVWV